MSTPDDVRSLFYPLPEEAYAADPEPPPKAFSVRLPVQLVAYIDDMAQMAGLSRNAMTTRLLDWGVQFALSNLDKDDVDRILSAYGGFPGYRTPYPVEEAS